MGILNLQTTPEDKYVVLCLDVRKKRDLFEIVISTEFPDDEIIYK